MSQQNLIEMLRHHAAHGSSDEIRAVCREMLAECEEADQPAHKAQTLLTSPAHRAKYLENLSRSLDAPVIEDEDKEQSHGLVALLFASAVALIVFGAIKFLQWWA